MWAKMPTNYYYQKKSMDIRAHGYFKMSVDIAHDYYYGPRKQNGKNFNKKSL
jgi:hypothetical protein